MIQAEADAHDEFGTQVEEVIVLAVVEVEVVVVVLASYRRSVAPRPVPAATCRRRHPRTTSCRNYTKSRGWVKTIVNRIDMMKSESLLRQNLAKTEMVHGWSNLKTEMVGSL